MFCMLEISQMHPFYCVVIVLLIIGDLLVDNAMASVLVSLLNSFNLMFTVFNVTMPSTRLCSNRGTCRTLTT